MPRLHFRHFGPRPAFGPAQLRSLEDQLGCRLPADYREFLLEYNGGDPDRKRFPAPHHPGSTWLDHLLPVDEHLATPCEHTSVSSIAFMHHAFGEVIPEDCLIVGIVARDNLLMLRLRGENAGRVELKVVADLGPNETARDACVHVLAGSFRAFLETLGTED